MAEPVGKAQHYLGVSTEDGLRQRLIQHARGYGAGLTRAASQRGIKLYLVRVFHGLGYQHERQMKATGRFRDLCPMCCELLCPADPSPYLIDADRPEQPPQRAIWGWTQDRKSE